MFKQVRDGGDGDDDNRLKKLNLSHNKIESVSLDVLECSRTSSITELDLSNNPITTEKVIVLVYYYLSAEYQWLNFIKKFKMFGSVRHSSDVPADISTVYFH